MASRSVQTGPSWAARETGPPLGSPVSLLNMVAARERPDVVLRYETPAATRLATSSSWA